MEYVEDHQDHKDYREGGKGTWHGTRRPGKPLGYPKMKVAAQAVLPLRTVRRCQVGHGWSLFLSLSCGLAGLAELNAHPSPPGQLSHCRIERTPPVLHDSTHKTRALNFSSYKRDMMVNIELTK